MPQKVLITPATAIGPIPSEIERDPFVLHKTLDSVSISESILSEIKILDLSIKFVIAVD